MTQSDSTLELSGIIEAMIFASSEPISADGIISILAEQDEGLFVDTGQVHEIISALNKNYEMNERSFHIDLVGGGYCFVTHKKYHKWLRLFQHQNEKRRLSPAGLEALAIIAYKQPVSKPEVDKIRGVDSGYVVRQLLEKELIEISGRSDSPGRPLLYRTSRLFLKHFGLNAIDDLPKTREIEDILNDEDMREHRQIMLELRQELTGNDKDSDIEDTSND